MFERGTSVEYVNQEKEANRGIRGTVTSDGVSESGLVIVQWICPTDPGISWSLLEEAEQLRPA